MKKIVRVTTVPLSLDIFCRGLLKELSGEYEVLAVSSPGPLLEEVHRREGVRTVAVQMERRPAPLKDIHALLELRRLFRRERPDMVHSMTPKAGLLSMMAARSAHVPVRVHTFTGLVFPTSRGLMRMVLKCTDRITAACATHVIAEGQGIRNDLTSNGITRKDVTVLGHGNVRGIDLSWWDRTPEIEAEASALRERFAVPIESFVFVFVGRLVADKGIEELVQAFVHLAERKDVHLLLAGVMEEEDPLPARTLELIASSSRIHCSGEWLQDVRPWIAAADALVHPSWREGFPNTVLEAGAMGLPAIVTDINGSREIISDSVNGLIVPPGSSSYLFKAMMQLCTDVSGTREMGARARGLIADRFEQKYVWDCLRRYYRAII